MAEHATYLLVDLCCILVPFLFSFHRAILFYKQWWRFLPACMATALVFVCWDIWFTQSGVWSFNPRYVCGIYLFGLPLEEYLFFVCIPYASVFTWYCVNRYFKPEKFVLTAKIVSVALVVLLSAVALMHLGQLYTSVTCLALALSISMLLFRKASFFPSFYLAYLIILIPFFISNGLLTGSLLKEPVVLYNNHYNMGIRMFTIPVEDTFYGMLLILLNVAGFEAAGKVWRHKRTPAAE